MRQGDNAANFLKFGKHLRLPQTALLSLQAPLPLPFDMGSSWYPMFEDNGERMLHVARLWTSSFIYTRTLLFWIVIQASPGEKRRLQGLHTSVDMVIDILRVLVASDTAESKGCGWSADRVILAGFSQVIAAQY